MFIIVRERDYSQDADEPEEVKIQEVRLFSCMCPEKYKSMSETEIAESLCHFKLLDGDGFLCYEGYYDGLYNYGDGAFEPLDAMKAYCGCVTMMYFEDNQWKEL